jgi:anti-sigma factor RsiW
MSGITCQEFVELATDYLEDALDDETRTRFDDHMAVCPGCETYLEQMKETAVRLGEIPVETISEEMQLRLLSAFRNFRR